MRPSLDWLEVIMCLERVDTISLHEKFEERYPDDRG